jgi:hypothetical protein
MSHAVMWRFHLRYNGTMFQSRLYDSPEEASNDRMDMVVKFHGDFGFNGIREPAG